MDRLALGRKGEEKAVAYLRARGWTILARNVRRDRKEVDVIVRRSGIVAFVEVKARRSNAFGHPAEAVTPRKRREIQWVARRWLQETALPPGTLLRFDVVAVTFSSEVEPEVLHLPDAWRPS